MVEGLGTVIDHEGDVKRVEEQPQPIPLVGAAEYRALYSRGHPVPQRLRGMPPLFNKIHLQVLNEN